MPVGEQCPNANDTQVISHRGWTILRIVQELRSRAIAAPLRWYNMPFNEPRAHFARPDIDAAKRLAANDFAYRQLCGEVHRLHRRNDPKLLQFIERVARFAWASHPGRLADGALENTLLEIGRDLADAPARFDLNMTDLAPSASRTLHVASEVYPTGGHSRVLAKWVQRDPSSSHAVVLTRQPVELPAHLSSIAAERGAPIIALDRSGGILDRAQQLRALSRGFSRVILHHHPDDSVPVLAYSVPGGCPVAMFNHAHFGFSLGSGVADVIINTMPYFQKLTERYRFSRATDVLEGPPGLDLLRWTDVDKRRAKERLGLPPEGPVAMTIGYERYFAPFGDMNFFHTLAKLLAARADLQVLAVGVREDSSLVPASIRESGRVRLVGPVADPRPYYEAADVCLESFPMPSLGALLEAVSYGQAFPVPAYAETESPSRVNQQRIASVAVRQRTEADYIRYVCELLDKRETTRERVGELRRQLIRDDECFADQFPSLYERIASFEHAPHELPRAQCSAASENLALASLTHLTDIGKAIDFLPLRSAIPASARAVSLGYERPQAAAARLVRRLRRSLDHRLRRR